MSSDAPRTATLVPEGITPTGEQIAIQTATESTIVVEANAGAAKTTTLALRMAECCARGARPDRVLALTYTEPARAALWAALGRLGVPFDVRRRFRVHTFESFSADVLYRSERAAVPHYDRPEQLKQHVLHAVERVYDNLDERWRDELDFPGAGDAVVEPLLGEFQLLKGTMLLDVEASESRITPHLAASLDKSYAALKAFRRYERDREGGKDYPRFRGPGDATYDLARACLAGIPQQHDGAAWPGGLTMIVVDEMHDVNRAMFEVLRQLLRVNRRASFCGVGDRDQVIHKVAGADMRFMGEWFDIDGSRHLHAYPLTASYRFGPRLAQCAGKLAGKRYASNAEHHTTVTVERFTHAALCEATIAEAAQRWRVAVASERKRSEFAVLLRHSHQSIRLENLLLQACIPYTMAGFDSYLMRPEILLVRGLLALATDDFSSVADPATRQGIVESFVFFGAIKIVARGGEDEDQPRLLQQAVAAVVESPRILRAFYENQLLRNAAPSVAKRLQAAVEVAQSGAGSELLGRMFGALDLRSLAGRVLVEKSRVDQVSANVAGLLESAQAYPSAGAFFEALNEFEARQRAGARARHRIVVSSIEAAKGLEFDEVHVPHVDRGVFPSSDAALDEERNLFYVAITRARRRLAIHCDAARPSRFVDALDNGRSKHEN